MGRIQVTWLPIQIGELRLSQGDLMESMFCKQICYVHSMCFLNNNLINLQLFTKINIVQEFILRTCSQQF